jgi:hypothetical protein
MPFGLIAASGWASGINLYGTALILGLAGRFGWAETPEVLQRPGVIAVAAILYVLEFVVDKVPWLDSAWDVVHTAIRPVGGALLGAALAHDAGSSEVLAGLLGGGFSLTAHGAKASARASVNTSPEPFSNIALSLGEDGVVAGLMALALSYPEVAGVLAVVLAVASVALAWTFIRAVRSLRRRWRARRAARRGLPVDEGVR